MNVDPLLRMPSDTQMAAEPWWRGAAIYQIYPRSFLDSNGDGIGDLPGITARLDHVAELGVDAVWISPFYASPMRDFGYDVSDYTGIDAIFGTMADFDAVIDRAHRLGLRVLIDQIYSHTSDQHPWFAESRASRDNPKADWYVWADAKPDGSPPTNWQSVFGGPAWTWDARRGQYYLHNFLSAQPQVNGHNPAVQDAMLAVARFWLDKGVDGFRVDALNFFMHDPGLRDNPPAPPSAAPRTRPFDFQLHRYNQSHPAIPAFLERLRGVLDDYDATFAVAEVGGAEAIAEMHAFTQGGARLHSAYGFDFLYAARLTPELVCGALAQWPGSAGEGWPSWAFENHDAPRAVSRWCAPEHRDAFVRMKLALLAALRGNVILFQGEELGLEQDDIPFERLRDPEAIANWPLTLSRDGVRTPLPWMAQDEHGGFTRGKPWLPLGEGNLARAVDRQEHDPNSVLAFTREVLALRRKEPALRLGALVQCCADGALLRIDRAHEGRTIACLFNLSSEPLQISEGHRASGTPILAINDATATHLPPYGALMVAA